MVMCFLREQTHSFSPPLACRKDHLSITYNICHIHYYTFIDIFGYVPFSHPQPNTLALSFSNSKGDVYQIMLSDTLLLHVLVMGNFKTNMKTPKGIYKYMRDNWMLMDSHLHFFLPVVVGLVVYSVASKS